MSVSHWLKTCWQGCRYCSAGLWRLVRWCGWLLLILIAGVQVVILASNNLHVPDFVVDEIESSLGSVGLQAEFAEVSLDPGGRLLLRDVDLSLAVVGTPIMRADAVYLEVNPWALWWREIEPRRIRFSGVDFLIPAILSPSGQSEAMIRGIDATLRPTETRGMLALDHFTAHIGAVPVSMHGVIQLPEVGTGPSQPLDQLMAKLSSHYITGCRQASRLLPHLAKLEGLQLDLTLVPGKDVWANVNLRAQSSSVTLPTIPGFDLRPTLHGATLQTAFALTTTPQTLPITLSVARAEGLSNLVLENLALETALAWSSQPMSIAAGELKVSVERIVHPVTSISAVTVRTNLQTLPLLQSQVTTRFGGEPWQLQSDLDITNGAGRIVVAGRVGSSVLDLAAAQIGFDVPSILKWETPPYLTAAVNLGVGAKPLRAEARFSTQEVEARWVPLTATEARVQWHGTSLRADQILLRTGSSAATGIYEMDTENLDFRFLLRGRLEPSRIDGWFRDWWPALFAQFDFTNSLPQAGVDVSGRWGAPLDTRVFISADAADPVIRDIPMDRMRTRLFTRPGWADVFHFLAERPVGDVEGSFLRQWRMPDSRRWTRVEIHAGGGTDLTPAPQLLRRTGEALIAPFEFDGPLQLRLDGSAVRDDWGAPTTETFDIRGSTAAPWRFKGFPFEGTTFSVRRQDEKILVDSFSAGMSGGALAGRIELQGQGDAQQVAFDLNLAEASLGRTIHDVGTWLAKRRGEAPADETEFEKQMAAGKLTLALTAEGPSNDLLGLKGSGSAAVANANFSNINLLGVLSALLERTILNFSTLQLNHANADFTLNGPQVKFSQIKATGQRGSVDASGDYSLADRSLDFTTRVRPFEGGEGLLDAVFTPFSSVLEVKLAGELSDPEWTFLYGPTNLLRNLTGENARNRASSAAAAETIRPAESAGNAPESATSPPAGPDELEINSKAE